MEASHKTHRPHIKVGKDEEEEEKMGKTILNWNNGNNCKLPNYKNSVRKTTEERKK